MSEGTPPPPPPENQPPAGGTPPPPAPPPSSPPPGQPGGYAAAPPPPPAGPVGPRPGELLDRFLARLIDLVILFVVTAIINIALIAALIGGGGNAFGTGGSVAYGIVVSIIGVVINLGYFGYMESSQGKTIGKMAMKLHVESAAGAKPTFEEAVKRNIWLALPILGVIPLIGGVIGGIAEIVAIIVIAVQINSDPQRRPWTDKFAGTQVIKEG